MPATPPDPIADLAAAADAGRWEEVDRIAAQLADTLGAPELRGYGTAARAAAAALREGDLEALAVAAARLDGLRERLAVGVLDPPARRTTFAWWRR